MSKSVLVIDTPKSCWECPCRITEQMGNNIVHYCASDMVWKFYIKDLNNKPTWCPLKPLPKRLGTASEYGSDEEYIKRLINWKKEVDKILGETDNE